MASPNLDQLSINLSHLINDPVTAATTNGDLVTSAYRTIFLNDAIRACIVKWTGQQDWMALRSYIKDGTATLTAGQSLLTAWTGTPFVILSAKNSTDGKIIKPVPQELKHIFDTGMFANYLTPSVTNQYYSIENGYFTLLDGTGTSTDSIYLRYVKEHSNLSVGATASTVLYDASFTYTVATLTISAFGSSITSAHVGGRVVGTDAGGNMFDRLITGYVGAGSFTIDSALTNAGTGCTAGYVIPPSQNDIEIDSQYWDEVLDAAHKIYLKRVKLAG